MKLLFRLLLISAVVLLVLALIAAFLPASVAFGLFEGRMGATRLEDVSGSIWNGRAGRVQIGEREFGALSWQLSPWGCSHAEPISTSSWTAVNCKPPALSAWPDRAASALVISV